MRKRSTKRKAVCTETSDLREALPPRHFRVEFWEVYALEGVKPKEALSDVWAVVHRLYCAATEFLHDKGADGLTPADDPEIEVLRRKLHAVEDILDHLSSHAHGALPVRKRERPEAQERST